MFHTRCSNDNKEKLSASIQSELASNFCHDRKSTFVPSNEHSCNIVTRQKC